MGVGQTVFGYILSGGSGSCFVAVALVALDDFSRKAVAICIDLSLYDE